MHENINKRFSTKNEYAPAMLSASSFYPCNDIVILKSKGQYFEEI